MCKACYSDNEEDDADVDNDDYTAKLEVHKVVKHHHTYTGKIFGFHICEPCSIACVVNVNDCT